jgi:hypothetical protein
LFARRGREAKGVIGEAVALIPSLEVQPLLSGTMICLKVQSPAALGPNNPAANDQRTTYGFPVNGDLSSALSFPAKICSFSLQISGVVPGRWLEKTGLRPFTGIP